MNYDVIGDIHGYASALEALLKKMGYVPRGRGYSAPVGHQAIFAGDLIDRGPEQKRVLEIVRSMVDEGSARAVMGNHEFNAIGFAQSLRPRTEKNLGQHAAFLAQIGEGSNDHAEWIRWFRTLPLALDLNGIRVAHAWWDEESVRQVSADYWDSSGTQMSDSFLSATHVVGSPMERARKILTCGVEWNLPKGYLVYDKAGHPHGEARLAVWRHWAADLRELALVPAGSEDGVPDIPIPEEIDVVDVKGAPIFIGHHWFTGEPRQETPKVACLDWSVAKGGCLTAYRWSGEAELDDENFVWVSPNGGTWE
jgi:hypothetical protein